ncbi:MAG: cytochrome P450 [bacterium]
MKANNMQPDDLYYDPYDYAIDADPHPVWRRMRDEAPLYYNREYDFYALSRYRDVYDASLDHQTFSSAHGTVLELMSRKHDFSTMMIWLDPPDHTQLRKLVGRTLTVRRVAELEPRIRSLCAEYLDPFVGSAGFDYVEEFAARLPVMVIGSLLGVPVEDQDTVRGWTDQSLHVEPGETQSNRGAVEAWGHLREYFQEQIDQRRRAPSDDLMSDLVASEIELEDGSTRRLSDDEVHGFVNLLSSAGNETVARLLGWTALLLSEHPEQREQLAADASLIPGAVEELLRYEAPSPIQARYVTRDVELHGQIVPEGSKIALLNGSAGRDEREFTDADRFDITRPIDSHVSFGYGLHFCIGASLARMEARVAIEETLARFPRWEASREKIEMVHTSTVRGPSSVHISL